MSTTANRQVTLTWYAPNSRLDAVPQNLYGHCLPRFHVKHIHLAQPNQGRTDAIERKPSRHTGVLLAQLSLGRSAASCPTSLVDSISRETHPPRSTEPGAHGRAAYTDRHVTLACSSPCSRVDTVPQDVCRHCLPQFHVKHIQVTQLNQTHVGPGMRRQAAHAHLTLAHLSMGHRAIDSRPNVIRSVSRGTHPSRQT
jgi:hypothetical protein